MAGLSSSEPINADRNVSGTAQLDGMLFDITIECSPEDAVNPTLEGLRMSVVLDAREGESDEHPLDRTSPTTWRYQGIIELSRDMCLLIIIQSEEAGEFGFLDLTNEISQYLESTPAAVQADPQRHKTVTEEGEPSLWMTFVVSAVEQEQDWQHHPALLSKHDQLLETADHSEEVLSGIDFFNAGTTIFDHFQETGSMSDLSNAIENLQQAVSLTPEDDPNKSKCLWMLGLSFSVRWDQTGNLDDISAAIAHYRRAANLTSEGDPVMAVASYFLGNAFSIRFERIGELDDLSAAIEHHQRSVALTPEGDHRVPSMLYNLGYMFLTRFKRRGDLDNLSAAVEHLQKSVALAPEGHPDMPLMLHNFGQSLSSRFQQTGDLADLSAAIEHHRKSVVLTPEGHPDMPDRLDYLGTSFWHRFKKTGDLDDLSAAIEHFQKSLVLTPEGHPDRPSTLYNFGQSLSVRFKQIGDFSDLSVAIEHLQKSVVLTPEGHPNMPGMLNDLGSSFLSRFERTGNIPDISAAIEHLQKSVVLTPKGHPEMPARLNNLGNSCSTRFAQIGDPNDLSAAIEHLRKSVVLTPEGHPDLPSMLNNLGNSCFWRFEHTDDLADLSVAIEHLQKSVVLTPEGHPQMPIRLSNLGGSILMRFGKAHDLADVSAAIEHYQKSVVLIPEGHPNVPTLLYNLGNSFFSRFSQIGDLNDLSAAIEHFRNSVANTPEGHVGMATCRLSLGDSLFKRFTKTVPPEDSDCQAAALNFGLAATQSTGRPGTRLKAARLWALCCHLLKDYPAGLKAYGLAIELLPLVAGLEKTIHNRHSSLLEISDLISQAVTVALFSESNDTALEWLEQGRCLTWNQLNQLRTPVDLLEQADARLAERFLAVSKALDTSGSRPAISWRVGATITQQMEVEDQVRSQLNLSLEFGQLLADIRALPNFDDFLQPPKAANILSRLPRDGPVVIINAHEIACDADALALIHGADEPIHIPLNKFNHEKAELLRNQLGYHLTCEKLRMRDSDDRGGRLARRPDAGLHHILRELWNCVVWPILQGLGYSSPPMHRNRIWFCATGPLAFLPIHAAGIYDPDPKVPGPCLSDFAVSSYIPTVTTLLEKLKNEANLKGEDTNVLLLSQPNGIPQAPIPGTIEETQTVLKKMRNDGVEALLLEDEEGTKDRVTQEMRTHGWIHIASHASQHPTEPLKSGFYLHDGQLELLEIIRQRLPSAEFAYLSACQTSVGDEKLTEEVVHLAAGMLAAGYQGVVATMWAINDRYAPKIAEDFYGFLLQEKRASGAHRLESRRAAYALDDATRKIRAKLGDSEHALLTWVPYIHHGL